MAAKKGNKVNVEYTGTFDDGQLFDSSENHGKPLEFELGKGQVIKGFEAALDGMEKGQEKEIRLEPSEAYGEVNPALQQSVPRAQFPPDREPEPGMMVVVGTPDGAQIPARISQVTKEDVTVDLNHPLAGKALNFRIKLLDIS
ncbi:peptidylprolyl isomerase [Candidatus Woesearchaeota archaeon]|nr:peptidylprolyl isomerase [Candidatus Woesearchaeota archaeon]